MSNSSDGKVRYALGLFVRVRDLESAVREIGAARLPLDQVKVIAPPEQSGSDHRTWSECGSFLGVDTWMASEASGPCPWNFAPVHIARAPADGGGFSKRDVIPDFHRWAQERHAQHLDRHLRSGGAIAVVRVRTDAEERAVSSTLLRHATAGVQTHEVSRHG